MERCIVKICLVLLATLFQNVSLSEFTMRCYKNYEEKVSALLSLKHECVKATLKNVLFCVLVSSFYLIPYFIEYIAHFFREK